MTTFTDIFSFYRGRHGVGTGYLCGLHKYDGELPQQLVSKSIDALDNAMITASNEIAQLIDLMLEPNVDDVLLSSSRTKIADLQKMLNMLKAAIDLKLSM